MTILAALLAVVVVLAVWLSNCIPGFGIGSSGPGDGAADDTGAAKSERAKPEPAKPEAAEPDTDKPEPAKPEPEALGAAGTTLTVTIDVGGCAVAESAPIDCAKICDRNELFVGIDDAVLEVAGASHGSVVAVIDCLKAKGIDKVAIRRE
jgi:hypothetical protein